MLLVHLANPLLGALAVGAAVHRAAALDHRQALVVHRRRNQALLRHHHRANHRHLLAGQIGHRLKARHPSLLEQVHDEGLDGVVEVVAQRNLVAPRRQCLVAQAGPPHPRAQAAGVGLRPPVKDNLPDLGALADVLHPQLLAQGGNRAVVGLHPAKARVQRQPHNLIGDADVGAQLVQAHQQRHRILSPADADGNPVPRLNHIIFFDGPPHQAGQFLHRRHPIPPSDSCGRPDNFPE